MRELTLVEFTPYVYFVLGGFSVLIVNWTFYLSFFQHRKCTCSDINMKKEAIESFELRLDVSSVDRVLEVR